MYVKKIKLILVFIILYQNPLYSKSTSFEDFISRTLSNYFSGIVAFENKDNSKSLDFFNTSKVLLNKHEPYFKRYIYTLVLENKIENMVNKQQEILKENVLKLINIEENYQVFLQVSTKAQGVPRWIRALRRNNLNFVTDWIQWPLFD